MAESNKMQIEVEHAFKMHFPTHFKVWCIENKACTEEP